MTDSVAAAAPPLRKRPAAGRGSTPPQLMGSLRLHGVPLDAAKEAIAAATWGHKAYSELEALKIILRFGDDEQGFQY